MPGPTSDSYKGTPDDAPYVPNWCFPQGKPKVCPCGHHEGYHNDKGECLFVTYDFGSDRRCNCTGLPDNCRTTDEEFWGNR